MAANSILKFFLPKDKVFFQLFESVSETVVQMAEKLTEVVHEKDFIFSCDEVSHLVPVETPLFSLSICNLFKKSIFCFLQN